MVVRYPYTTLIQAHGEADINLDAACANLLLKESSQSDTFSISRTAEQPELTRVIDMLNSSGVDYAVEQAAIWIVTNNATFDELGILVGGSRVGPSLINENETVRAMMVIDKAGIDILKYAIWGEREQLVQKVTEPDLIAWLAERGVTVVAQPTPTP